MNSRDESAYRLKLANGYLAKAENDAADQQSDDCLANAQEAVENAGKAILGHFNPIPRTHNVIDPLARLSAQEGVPEAIRAKLQAGLDAFRDMGLETHVRATYGDESTHAAPWELIKEPEARSGLAKARETVEVADQIHNEVGQSPQG